MTRGVEVDFYYGIGSRYSYLASTQIAALETETGCRVTWHPLYSAGLMRLRGRDPFDGGSVSGQYDWPYRRYDAECWAEFYGVPYREPDFENYDPHVLARACVAARRLGAGVAYSTAMFRAVFVDGGQIDESVCADLAEREELPRDRFAATMADPDTEGELRATMAEAHRRGAFGVPTFFVGERMFWGNDRLVLLRHHLQKRTE